MTGDVNQPSWTPPMSDINPLGGDRASAASGTGLSQRAAEPEVSALRASIADVELWPVYEFRPTPAHSCGVVLRYADGQWLADDGQFDVAFISYGMGAPLALYVDLPFQRNIIWKGLTTHWSGCIPSHPRGNPWHYMLRDGEADWGGDWSRDQHFNTRVGRSAMSKCSSINGCANGRGPSFEQGDEYIVQGLLRERDSHLFVDPPSKLDCMYCGEAWGAS